MVGDSPQQKKTNQNTQETPKKEKKTKNQSRPSVSCTKIQQGLMWTSKTPEKRLRRLENKGPKRPPEGYYAEGGFEREKTSE